MEPPDDSLNNLLKPDESSENIPTSHMRKVFGVVAHSPTFLPLLVVGILLLIGTVDYVRWRAVDRTMIQNHGQRVSSSPSPVPSARWKPVSTEDVEQQGDTANSLMFRDPSGGYIAYSLPSEPLTEPTWTSFTDNQGGYSIEYPKDWIKVAIEQPNQKGFRLCPPTTNLRDQIPGGPKCIEAVLTDSYTLPAEDDPTVANRKEVTVSGVTGHFFTAGALGKSVHAAFPRTGRFLVLTANLTGVSSTDLAEDGSMIDAFQHVLVSLKLF
ncbi:hypothetical protein HY404_02185 [Candidatus Microgenomates bacterium]|nr:hypothetical protein [Candidatus Microgenomates bacterium]